MAHPLRRLGLAASALWLVCSPAHAIVNTADPVEGPAQAGPIPALPVANPPPGGFLVDWPDPFTGENFVQEGSYSWAPNLAAPPVSTLGGDCASLLPLGSLDTTFPPSLIGHLGDALVESSQTVDQLFANDGGANFLDAVGKFLDVLAQLPGSTPPTLSHLPDQRTCLSYAPLHARWLASQYKPKLITYHASPKPFREIRERGVRLYCAARTAQAAQSQGFSMGERVGFTVNVLGQPVDFFVTEPSLTLDGPERFTGAGLEDGAQAFEVPLLFGTRVTPIRGLPLPGFDEVRVPVSLVAADAELRNRAELGLIVLATEFGGHAVVVQGHRKSYQTATHLDLIRSGSKGASLDGGETPLFRVGPVAVALGLDLSYGIGAFATDDTRVLAPGPTAREGRLWVQPGSGRRNHEGHWRLVLPSFGIAGRSGAGAPTWVVDPDGVTDPFWRKPVEYLLPPPLEVRLIQNDDHAVRSETFLAIGGSLSGVLGGKFGPVEVSLKVTGELDGEVRQHFLLRDALLAQDQGGNALTPISGLAVRSKQTGSAELKPATGTLHLHLDLFFDSIDWEEQLFSVEKVTLASYDSDDDLPATGADDLGNFRLGTGSRQGDVMKQPVVWSHFPGLPSEFQSFPAGVDACLADPTENTPTPTGCEGVPAQGEVPSAELCVYGPANELEGALGASLPPNVCQNIAGFVNGLTLDSAQRGCIQTYLEFLCSPVSKQQALAGNFSEVVSHVFQLEDPEEQAAFTQVIEECAAAFGSLTKEGAEPVAQALVATKACLADGTLLDGADLLGAVNPTQAPPVTPGPPCH